MERTVSLAEQLHDLEGTQPTKVVFMVQVLESKAIKTMFPEAEKHEPLRLAAQKLTLDERKTMLINLIDPAYGFKKSKFTNNTPEEVKRIIQVNYQNPEISKT